MTPAVGGDRASYGSKLQKDVRFFRVGVLVVVCSTGLFFLGTMSTPNIAGNGVCVIPVFQDETSRRPLPSVLARPNKTSQPFSSAVASARNLSFPSEHIIVRAVYLDPRPRDGFLNTSVFLAEVRKDLLARGRETIVACGANTAFSTTLRVRVAKNSAWPNHRWPHLTHDIAMIDCFGLPSTASGARAFLWYRLTDGGELYRVESDQPYFVPQPKETQNHDDLKIVLCMATVRDSPPFMREFLRYYKHLGVDHVYMVAEDSFVKNGILEGNEFIREALLEGFISFTFWHRWLTGDQVYCHSQMLAHEDCIYRFQGTYDYALLVDSDDHFIPLVPNQKKLDFYIKQYCKVGACVFRWIEYYPDCGQDWSRLGPHGNVTNTLLSNKSTIYGMYTGKSLYKISATLDAGTHNPQRLMNGYRSQHVPSNAAYIAHVRKSGCSPHGRILCGEYVMF